MFDWLRSVYESIVSALVPEEDRHPFREMYGAGVIGIGCMFLNII